MSFDILSRRVILHTGHFSQEERFILQFFQHQELVQICMYIYNECDPLALEKRRYPLKNTYAIVGANRHFADIIKDAKLVLNISDRDWSAYVANQNTKSFFSLSYGYYLCVIKLWELFPSYVKQYPDIKSAVFALHKSDYFLRLQSVVEHYLHMKLMIAFEHNNLYLYLTDEL